MIADDFGETPEDLIAAFRRHRPVTLLLDTHVLLWWLAEDDRLTPARREAIAEPTTPVVVSAAPAWEMAIKAGLGKLTIPGDLAGELGRQRLDELLVTVDGRPSLHRLRRADLVVARSKGGLRRAT